MRTWLQRLIGPAVLAYLLATTDLKSILDHWAAAKPALLVLGILATAPVILLRAVRWHLANRGCGINLPLGKELHIYLASLALGLVTPGRAGEFVRVHYVSRSGYASSRAMVAAMVDRLADLVWMAAVGYLGLILYVWEGGWSHLWMPVAGLLALGFLWWLSKRQSIAANSRGESTRLWERILNWLHEFLKTLGGLGPSLLATLALLTVASWLVQYLQASLFSQALGIDLQFWEVALFISMAGLMSVLPVSVAGIGTRDLALIFLFGKVGQAPAAAIAFSGLLLFNFLVTAAFCALALLRRPAINR